MGQNKLLRKYDVTVHGGTVIFVSHERASILVDFDLCWIELRDKTVLPFPVQEGMVVWVYLAKAIKRVILVMKNEGEEVSQLLQMEPIEA